MNDLFKTKQEQLLDYMRQKHYFATHDIIKWASQNFYNRADRTKRNFLEQGIIRKLPEQEKIFRGFNSKDAWYEVVK